MNQQATAAPHPLIARLGERHGYPEVTPQTLDAFRAQPGDGVLFFPGDPVKHPETLDVAAILPELLARFDGRLRAGVVMPWNGPALQPRFGFQRWPALVFVRGGEYVGAIGGVRNWNEYLEEIGRLLAAPPSRPPSIGVAVRADGDAPSCH